MTFFLVSEFEINIYHNSVDLCTKLARLARHNMLKHTTSIYFVNICHIYFTKAHVQRDQINWNILMTALIVLVAKELSYSLMLEDWHAKPFEKMLNSHSN